MDNDESLPQGGGELNTQQQYRQRQRQQQQQLLLLQQQQQQQQHRLSSNPTNAGLFNPPTINPEPPGGFQHQNVARFPQHLPPLPQSQPPHPPERYKRQTSVASTVSSATKQSKRDSLKAEETPLGPDFQPGPWHVICGRSKTNFFCYGNIRLRIVICNNLKAYSEAPTRRDKSELINKVTDLIRLECGGGFLKKDKNGQWVDLGPTVGREKVSHSFRDSLLLKQPRRTSNSPVQEGDRQRTWKEAQNEIFRSLKLQSDQSSPTFVEPTSADGSVEMPVVQQQKQQRGGDTLHPPTKKRRASSPPHQANNAELPASGSLTMSAGVHLPLQPLTQHHDTNVMLHHHHHHHHHQGHGRQDQDLGDDDLGDDAILTSEDAARGNTFHYFN